MCSVDALPYFDTCIHGDVMIEYMSLSDERREVKDIRGRQDRGRQDTGRALCANEIIPDRGVERASKETPYLA